MQDKLENKFTMYKALESLLDANSAKLSPITALTPIIADFKDRIVAIQAKDDLANTADAGNTSTKANDEAALISDAVTIAAALYALGASTNDEHLKELSKVTKSSLKNLRDTQLTTQVSNIKNLADANSAALAGYGITAPMITDLDAKITAFNTSLGARELGSNVSSAAFQQMEIMFKETDKLLKEQMDKIMEIFRTSDPQFYSEYEQSREIIDLGHRFKDNDETPADPDTPDNP
ncbi:MAG TPA: hypothetical protein DHV28_12525 [Ignavibacteriales bacterium]|nr:hypothetical protein [Ignavibacteriales bacterium]